MGPNHPSVHSCPTSTGDKQVHFFPPRCQARFGGAAKTSLTPSGRKVHLCFLGAGGAPVQVFCSWVPHMLDQRRGQTGACSSLREPSLLWGGRGTHVHFLPPAHEIELDAIRGNKCTSLIPALVGHHCRFCGVGSRTGSYSLRRHNQGPSMGLDTPNMHGSHTSNGNTGALFSPMSSSALWGASDNKCTFHCPLLKTSLTPSG